MFKDKYIIKIIKSNKPKEVKIKMLDELIKEYQKKINEAKIVKDLL